jgi:hypothetical protein
MTGMGGQYRRNIQKEQLPLVLLSGIFEKRRKTDLIKHSKLICLDVDKIPDACELKEKLKKVVFIHYMFISPSNNGLKIIIKLNAITEKDHIQFFLSLEKYFKDELEVEIDKACKDISRACYLSYDEAPYWNKESITLNNDFIEKYFSIENREIEISEVKSEGVQNNDDVLQQAVQKFLNAKKGDKHSVLLKISNYLGYYINAKQLEYTTCYNALKKAIEQRKDELDSVNQAITTVEKGLIYGIENPKPINHFKISTKYYQFWYGYEGSISIRSNSFYTFLNRHGFWGYNYNNNRKLVRVQKNVVSIVEKEDIIDFAMDYIRKLDYDLGDGCTRNDLLEKFHNKLSHLTSENQLTTFLKLSKPFLSDSSDYSYLYYQNGILKITKNEIQLLNYNDVKGLIWKTSIIDRDYEPTIEQIQNHEHKGDFAQFIKGVTGDNEEDKTFSRYKSMRTILGYLISEHKDWICKQKPHK